MTPEVWGRIQVVYESALKCAPEQRARFLEEISAEDAEVVREVLALLAQESTAEHFLEEPIPGRFNDADAEPEPLSATAGDMLGPYRIESLLGSGGMGEVYRACDTRLGRAVAIKVLRTAISRNASARARFQREAKLVSALNHPSICALYDIGEHGAREYLVLELLEGESLDTAATPMPIEQAINFGRQIAEALSAAHSQGIIHRDIKPANLFAVQRGGIKILDFGLAKADESDLPLSSDGEIKASLTQAGMLMGTVAYMSPEQARGEPIGAATDLFSLGVVLYQWTTGKLPFDGDTAHEVRGQILAQDPAPPASVNRRVPRRLGKLILALLEKDAARRPVTAAEVAERLRELERGIPRRRVLLYAGGTALTAGAVFAGWRVTRRPLVASLAVLPFVTAATDAGNQYLADRVTEGLIQNASRWPGIRVTGRATSVRLPASGMSYRDIAALLDAEVLLEGDVSVSVDRVRIRASLFHASSGQRWWERTFERPANDIPIMEAEMTRAIASELGIPPHSIIIERSLGRQAYESFLKARFFWNKRNVEGSRLAIRYLEEAIQHEPEYAPFYAALADVYNPGVGHTTWVPVRERADRTVDYAQRALRLNPELGEAHGTLGWHSFYTQWKWRDAEHHFSRCLKLSPNYSAARGWFAMMLATSGRGREALDQANGASQIDPLSLIVNLQLGNVHYFGRQLDRALGHYRKVLEMDASFSVAYDFVERICFLQGRRAEQLEALTSQGLRKDENGKQLDALLRTRAARRVSFNRTSTEPRYMDLARIYVYLGDHEQALYWLEAARRTREIGFSMFQADPVFDRLLPNPRLVEIRKAVLSS